ncbi:MAG: ornithine cyclodeaminase family protein [Devosia sp.]
MMIFSEEQVRTGLPWTVLIDALRQAFIDGVELPQRQHFDVGTPGLPGTLLIMPAWKRAEYVGIKLVTVFPSNRRESLPALTSVYTLFDGRTGRVLAQIDGGELTARRTAAASVLAAQFLARPESSSLLVMGTGRVSRNLAQAYCSAFPIERIAVWGRSPDKAAIIAEELAPLAPSVQAAGDLAGSLARADIVTTATLARDPIVLGRHLRPGTHVDLVGSFQPGMREADDDTIAAAAEIFVDTFNGAIKEAGDLAMPLASGVLARGNIVADLAMLCRRTHPGRTDASAVTIFKSVGTALEDLAGAMALVRAVKT